MVLLFLESVGTTELVLILVVALIIFGPRKLPELSRSLGKGLNEFRRASDEFKRTWEREVEMEGHGRRRELDSAMLPEDAPPNATALAGGDDEAERVPFVAAGEGTIARGSAVAASSDEFITETDAHAGENVAPQAQPPAKSDWL